MVLLSKYCEPESDCDNDNNDQASESQQKMLYDDSFSNKAWYFALVGIPILLICIPLVSKKFMR